MKKTKVVHKNKDSYDVYIGRPSKWGNPYSSGKDGTRSEVIQMYREYILNTPELIADLPELQGKRIACWCKPLACHGDVLAELADIMADGVDLNNPDEIDEYKRKQEKRLF